MRHPYQCLATAILDEAKPRQVLLAASGPELFVYDLLDATLLARWPGEDPKDEEDASNSSAEIITTSNEPAHRAKKRRKIAAKANGAHQRGLGGPITNLVVSNDGRYAIASTGEDKLIHVFAIEKTGGLQHLSQRRMTKRPCAITLTPRNDSILVGDKFGDVYALPLQFQELESVTKQADVESQNNSVPPTPFKPSATNLTVHTARNLNALKNQMQQANQQPAKQKDIMDFPHELLLGHVSMLTDVLCASKPSLKAKSVNRAYIVTSDRDEHIRVSRGAPQAYIIEKYCFGHEQFVSKLCLAEPDILVSGGGDSHLFVWDWSNGIILGTLPIQSAVEKLRQTQPASIDQEGHSSSKGGGLPTTNQTHATGHEIRESQTLKDESDLKTSDERVAVAGIWAQPSDKGSDEDRSVTVYCSCEAIPAIFEFTCTPVQGRRFTQDSVGVKTYALSGNPLGLTFLRDKIVVSVDTAHEKGSITARRKTVMNDENQLPRLLSLEMGTTSNFESLNIGIDDGEELVDEGQFKKLKDLVYGVENLRKHSGEDAEQ